MIKWGQQYQASRNNNTATLFGELTPDDFKAPDPPPSPEWNTLTKLRHEVDVAGIYLSTHPLRDFEYEVRFCASAKLEEISLLHSPQNLGRRIRFCGVVTNIQHRTNQKGEGFGSFILQDETGEMPVRLFKEKYLSFKPLLVDGATVMVEGVFEEERWKKEPEIGFRISHICMLSSALEYVYKKLTIFMDIRNLSSELVQQLENTCRSHSGLLVPKMVVVHPEDEMKLEFISPKKKIQISGDLLSELEKLGFNYKLN